MKRQLQMIEGTDTLDQTVLDGVHARPSGGRALRCFEGNLQGWQMYEPFT